VFLPVSLAPPQIPKFVRFGVSCFSTFTDNSTSPAGAYPTTYSPSDWYRPTPTAPKPLPRGCPLLLAAPAPVRMICYATLRRVVMALPAPALRAWLATRCTHGWDGLQPAATLLPRLCCLTPPPLDTSVFSLLFVLARSPG
jgi:hypothetical protein